MTTRNPAPALLASLAAAGFFACAVVAEDRIGWSAELSTLSHNVSGTVTIVDADTVQVEDFYYDGGGIDVYFYLGAQNTKQSFAEGLGIGDGLLGTVYEGESFSIDLPPGETLDGWNAVSVWCVPAQVNFGSGEFLAPPCYPDMDGSGMLDLFDFLAFTNLFNAQDPGADCDGGGSFDLFDFLCFVNAFDGGC